MSALRPVPSREPAQDGDEQALVGGVRAGDARAFESIFRRYHRPLCEFVYRYIRSRAEAEEIVHDVFTRVWERRASWDVRGALSTYLFGAARNRAFNVLKHQLVERRWREAASQAVRDAEVDRVARVASELTDADERLATEAIGAVVEGVLATLPERCRMAVALRWQRQLSYAEIAEAMGISIKTVEIYIGRGTKALREAYPWAPGQGKD